MIISKSDVLYILNLTNKLNKVKWPIKDFVESDCEGGKHRFIETNFKLFRTVQIKSICYYYFL